ncbi:MAG: peptide ABC transporter substrate-binding protein [Phycisphaerae bacterium]|nr:peptide ABC transporter substrate-binding protein [Phycisphaerae bacterium]
MAKLVLPFALLALLIGATLLTDRPAPPADFTFINRGDVTTLDIQTQSWMQDLRVTRILFEGLIGNDVHTWEFATEPRVAERWEVSADGRTYTFHLRESARWSNGEPVVASDFIYSWRRALLPELAADYAAFFHLIRGGKAFYDWRAGALATFAPLRSSALGSRADEGNWAALARDLASALDAALRDSKRAAEEGTPVEPVDLGFLADLARARGGPTLPTRAGLAALLWRETERRFVEMVGLSAPDGATLVVELERPTPYFLSLCAFPVFYPVYPPLVRSYERVDATTAALKTEADWTKPPRLVSNGPFELVTWRFKRDMRFEVNPHYWNRERLAIRSIAIPSIEDANAVVLAYRTGRIDWVSDVTAEYRAEILREKREYYGQPDIWPRYQSLLERGVDQFEIDRQLPTDPLKRNHIHACPAFGTYFYNFNCRPRLADGRPNPFADALVRRAFAMAVDKSIVTDQIRRTGEPVARTLIPVGSLSGYSSPEGLPFDPEGARALLARAGHPGGRGLPTIEILFNKDAGHDLIAQSIGKQWQQHLGVAVLLSQKEIKVFRDDLKKANYMVSRAGWFGDYGDPTTFLGLNRTGDGNNDRKYSSAAYDALLDRARDEPDRARRLEILSEAERLIVEEDLPLLPIFHYVQIYLFDPHRLTGISAHPRSEQSLQWVDILGDGLGRDRPMMLPPRPPSTNSRLMR